MPMTPQDLHAHIPQGKMGKDEYKRLRAHAEAVAAKHFKVPTAPVPFLTPDMWDVLEANDAKHPPENGDKP